MDINSFIETINTWGQQKTPFLFLIDFEMKKPVAIKLGEVDPNEILFDVNGFTNSVENEHQNEKACFPLEFKKSPIDFTTYKKKFDQVVKRLNYGDSFLTNLTIATPVSSNYSLRELFYHSKAPYKLWFRDQFLVFSPEIFIQIKDQKIISFPMKGTIDASIPNAEKKILSDEKEMAEHITIVDLLRNDLSLVSSGVEVSRFRYTDEIRTSHKTLLQVSSEISGKLDDNYLAKLGDIIVVLLPAGSISGAPKEKTVEIIRETEEEKRGYFTGVFGYFDGENLDSGVMIRFIENTRQGFVYRSGGGITAQSDQILEYQEAIDKVYVPVY